MGVDEVAEVVRATPDGVRPGAVPVRGDVGEGGVREMLAGLASSASKRTESS